MPGLGRKISDYLSYLAVRLAVMFLQMFPVEKVYSFAGWAADLWYDLDARRRKRALDHLQASFPDWDYARLDRTARASFRSLAYLGLEASLTTRMVTHWRWNRYIDLPHNREATRLLTRRKTGVVLVSGHLGGWEIAGYALATLGFKGYAVARALDNPHLNRYLLGSREKMGMRVLDKRGVMDVIDEIFQNKDYLAFIADQDAGPTGIFVDFLGRPASTYKAPALVAMQYGIPLAVAYSRRLNETYRFKLEVEQVIYPHQWQSQEDPLRWITQQYTKALERVIRRYPEQYLWIYRRWKTRPKEQQAGK